MIRRIHLIVWIWIVLAGCAEEKKQIVVPAVGMGQRNPEVKQQMLSQLQTDFPKLKPNAIEALDSIPRMLFVTSAARHRAYEDKALPIGSAQATLKLSDIAWLLSEIDIQPSAKVLEIGTGTGYFTAILSRLAAKVYSIEVLEYLSEISRSTLDRLKIENVKIRNHDGHDGWPIYAPYDVIIVTAAVKEIPSALISQLAPMGIIAAPIRSNSECAWHIFKSINGELQELSQRPSNVPNIIEPLTSPLE